MMSAMSWQERLDKSALLRSSAALQRERNQFFQAKKNLEQALDVLNSDSIQDPVPVIKVLHELGSLAQEQGMLAESERYYLQALDLCEKSLGSVAIGTASRLNHLAWLYRQQGDLEKPAQLLTRSLNIYLDRLGSVNKPVALMLMALAVLNKRKGNEEQAEKYQVDLRFIQEQLKRSSKTVETAIRISSIDDTGRKRNTTTQIRQFGIIPGDAHDFPQLEFVIDSLLCGSEEETDPDWEESIQKECTQILKKMDSYLDKFRGKAKGPLEKYEENSDGTISVQAGYQEDSSSLARVKVRISGVRDAELLCEIANDPALCDSETFVPAALVPDYLKDELFRGARVAFADLLLSDGTAMLFGLRFEFIEAVVAENDEALKGPFRNAGWLAISGWAKSKGMKLKSDSKNRLWQYPIV